MKKINIIEKESKIQKIAVRQQNLVDWRRKTKIGDLLNFNKIQVEKLVC